MNFGEQTRINAEHWQAGRHVREYASRTLHPVEVLLLVRYRDQLAGRVLEVGCGAGRVLGYLVELSQDVHGLDLSPEMVSHCRTVYPEADVRVGDVAAFQSSAEEKFDAILAVCNILDVFDDSERRRILSELRERIAPAGVLIFSSHNLSDLDRHAGGSSIPGSRRRRAARLRAPATLLLSKPPIHMASLARRLPQRIRNRRRLAPLQHREADHAIINDSAHDYGLLHYYIRRNDQDRQLSELGYELVECLDVSGKVVAPGQAGAGPWLHYVARPSDPAD